MGDAGRHALSLFIGSPFYTSPNLLTGSDKRQINRGTYIYVLRARYVGARSTLRRM